MSLRTGTSPSLPLSARAIAVPLLLALVVTAAAPAVITVRPGDSLWGLARRHGSTVAQLRALNGISGNQDLILVGQTLRVAAAPAAAAAAAAASPTVAANRARMAARSQPSKAYVRSLVARTARAKGVDPALALAVATNESGFQQRVVSGANAIGAMQVLPSTAAWLSREVLHRPLDLFKAEDNVLAGVTLLALLVRNHGTAGGLAGYYQGIWSVRQNGLYDETKAYVATILALRGRYA